MEFLKKKNPVFNELGNKNISYSYDAKDLIRCMALKCLYQELNPLSPGLCTKRAPVLIPACAVCEVCNCPEFLPSNVYMDIRVFQINNSVIIAATTLYEAVRFFQSLPLDPISKGNFQELALSTVIYSDNNIQKPIHRIVFDLIDNGFELPLLIWPTKINHR